MKDKITEINQQTSAVYVMGLIGSFIYFIQHAHNFGEGIIGFIKALVWPALLAYHALEFLKM